MSSAERLTPIRVLILEDREQDAELMLLELRRSGFEPEWKRVDNEPDYLAGLDPEPDLILADYSLPEFDGLRALTLLKDRGLSVPFILVTGGYEELGVACLKHGAADYVIKDRMARLGPAVIQALEEHELRVEKRAAERALQESEQRYRALFEDSRDAIVIANGDGKIIDYNYAALRAFGYHRDQMLTISERDLFAEPRRADEFTEQLNRHGAIRDFSARLRTRDGYSMDCLIAASQRSTEEGTALVRSSVIRRVG